MIRRLLWTLLVVVAALMLVVRCAQAQSCQPDPANNHGWCNSVVALSSLQLINGGSEVVTVQFATALAVTGGQLDIEIFDPTGARVTGGQSWTTGVNFTAGSSVQANPLVWTVPAGQIPGTYTVKLGAFLADNTLAYWNGAAATFTVIAVAGPDCLPKAPWTALTLGQVPQTVSARYSVYIAYLCATPKGYQSVSYLLSPTSDVEDAVLRYIAGFLSPADASAMIIAGTDPTLPTLTESGFINTLLTSVQPTIKVAFNGVATTRPVYNAKADGTLNPAAIAGELVAVADPCDARFRVAGTTNYFSVAGRPNVNGGTLPANSYTICVITAFPHGVN